MTLGCLAEMRKHPYATPHMMMTRTLFTFTLGQGVRAAFMATAVLLALVWLLQSLRFLDFLVNKGLGLGVFLHLTGLLIPRLLVVIIPIGVLAGSIMVARRMQDDHETTATLAAGASPWVLVRPLLVLGLAGAGVLYTLMLFILPSSITAFKDLQTELRTQQGQLLLEEGTFNPLGDDLMVYVQRRLSEKSFAQLLVHDTRNPAEPVTWYAKYGEVSLTPEGAPQLKLGQGLRQELGTKGNNVLEFASYALDLSPQLGVSNFKEREPEVEERGLRETWQLRNDTTLSDKNRSALKAEVLHRLTWPLLAIPLALLGAAALMHPPKRKQSSIRGVVLAAVCGIVVLGAQFGWLSLVQGGADWAMPLMAAWPAFACVLAYGVWRLQNV